MKIIAIFVLIFSVNLYGAENPESNKSQNPSDLGQFIDPMQDLSEDKICRQIENKNPISECQKIQLDYHNTAFTFMTSGHEEDQVAIDTYALLFENRGCMRFETAGCLTR